MKSIRKLQFGDTFRIARIINAAGVTTQEIVSLISENDIKKKEIADIKNKAEREQRLSDLQNAAGMEMIGYIIEKAPNAEAAINKLLGSLAGKTDKEISEASVTEIFELVKDIFEQNGDIKDFFISGLRSAKVMPSTKS